MLYFVYSNETIKLTLWLTKLLMIALLAAPVSMNALLALSLLEINTTSMPMFAQSAVLAPMFVLWAQS